MSKLIVVTAPSGAGKTTIVHHLLDTFSQRLAFSVSATTRQKRDKEEEGKDYYYIDVPKFKQLIAEGAFLEWEEVYENQFYGTLKSEVERLWGAGKSVIFDIDVKGAINLQKAYPGNMLTIFIKPPSEEVLLSRLRKRRSESEESLRKRIAKATYELTFEKYFDIVLVNDVLETALKEAEAIVSKWLDS
ncbi:MAG: guanylate kinase [Lewinellaceae bacterium]|nr:guanylate kinase [Saprospiraceae bacterium]MCB9337105.1 guanylate kinase [Lewinellaceae bacterium]